MMCLKTRMGKKVTVKNVVETTVAQTKQSEIEAEFIDWIWNDEERRRKLEDIYNNLFNAERVREYDGSHLTFPGMNPDVTLRPHQSNAIARQLYGGNTLLAHSVGAGKTYTIIATKLWSANDLACLIRPSFVCRTTL